MQLLFIKYLPQDIMIFSASKHCGLAGTRFGWGLYRNKELANQISKIVDETMYSIPEDSMLRTYNTINQVLSKHRAYIMCSYHLILYR